MISSPYLRAKNTVAPFAKNNGLTVEIIENLHERVLASQPLPDWLVHVRRSFDDFGYSIGGGESLTATRYRALGALREILGLGYGFAAVATHGNLIASILAGLDSSFGFDEWQRMKTPDLFVLRFENRAPVEYTNLETLTEP